jgi:peptidoglycan hydrolase-like protein with peptidoglycan-binding domain
MLHRCPSALVSTLLAALVNALFSSSSAAFEPDVPTRVDRSFGPRVAAAVADAGRRLERQPCALVLSDFVDSRTGATLAENLAAKARTASEHVDSLRFLGAPGPRPFGGRRVFAFTVPASPVVYLCRDDLLRIQNQERLLTAVVIHEVLHTLGLREDAPTSVAITEQVLARCF